jgi:MFS family permease
MGTARTAIFVTFAFCGMVVGSWTSRVPALSRQVHAGPGEMGLALLGTSIGLVLIAPFTGRLCARFGARFMVLSSVMLAGLVLPLLGLAPSVPILGGAMFLLGIAIGGLDVSMNIAAVTVTRQLDRPLMPTFHAAYSFGALAGGLVAGWLVALGWSPLRHFTVAASVGVVVVLVVARSIPDTRPDRSTGPRPTSGYVSPIRRPMMWLLAGIMLGSAIAEGANGDWSALFLVHERGIGESAATVGFACFNIAMAVARLLGERWERRWGPYRLLGAGATLAALGMFTVVLVPWVAVDYVGFALVGIGLAFGFPVAIGLAGAAGRRADGSGGEREIGFVTSIAYTGFLAGPPAIGAIAQATNLAVALGVVGLIITLILPLVVLSRRGARREPAPVPDGVTAGGGNPALPTSNR